MSTQGRSVGSLYVYSMLGQISRLFGSAVSWGCHLGRPQTDAAALWLWDRCLGGHFENCCQTPGQQMDTSMMAEAGDEKAPTLHWWRSLRRASDGGEPVS